MLTEADVPVQDASAVSVANFAFRACASWPFFRWKSEEVLAGAAADEVTVRLSEAEADTETTGADAAVTVTVTGGSHESVSPLSGVEVALGAVASVEEGASVTLALALGLEPLPELGTPGS